MYKNKIGTIRRLITLLNEGADKIIDLGLETIQLSCWEPELYTQETADKIKAMLGDKIEITSVWAGWTGGPRDWNVMDGPYTLGIVPEAYRARRLQEVIDGAKFAKMLGVKEVATHVGFIPEQPASELYRGVMRSIRYLAEELDKMGLYFNFETGQETPVTLMRMITDVDMPNVGINLDPANLIMYGKGNPIDALDIFKGKIRGVHIKDGDYPTDFYGLGAERVVGEGTVNFDVFLPKLLKQGYTGDLYIEREINGDQQIADIKKTISYVKELMK
ncbi:MAG: TIM barrel protein [Clostridia bacterium]|nr:TIM barrel protein [Clostridia bacterium]MBR2878184.1 TIM barrel protein [Clostridia bacterium]MBR3576781.1 TIM barrel protein [Clostridia bacterium]